MPSNTCGNCRHFFSSERANQGSVLAGFGYCHATDIALDRARFFRGDFTVCWQNPPRFTPAASISSKRERGGMTLAGMFWLLYLSGIAAVLLWGMAR